MTEFRNSWNVSLSLSCVTIWVVLSVMVGQNVLQTSFRTSGLLMKLLTLCAPLKLHVDKCGQTILCACWQLNCLLSQYITYLLCWVPRECKTKCRCCQCCCQCAIRIMLTSWEPEWCLGDWWAVGQMPEFLCNAVTHCVQQSKCELSSQPCRVLFVQAEVL